MACVKSIVRKRNLISLVPLELSTKDAELLGSHNHAFRKCRCVQETNMHRIEFSHDELYRIGRRVGMDSRYKQLDRSACITIRKLRLNRRGKRGGRRLKSHTHSLGLISDGVNSANLTRIKMETTHSMIDSKFKLTMSLLNAQSIKNKELILHGQLIHHDVDICVLTETWLSDSDLDRTWLQCTVLNKAPYWMFTSNRTGKKRRRYNLDNKNTFRS